MSNADARRLLRRQQHGVLSTLSKKLDGYPFGSVTPFVLDHQARPVILISTLAEHTKNIAADPRVSLLAHDTSTDIQANARGDSGWPLHPHGRPDCAQGTLFALFSGCG